MGRPKSYKINIDILGGIEITGHLGNAKVDKCSGGAYEIKNSAGVVMGLVGSRMQGGRQVWHNSYTGHTFLTRENATVALVMGSLVETLFVNLKTAVEGLERAKAALSKQAADKPMIVMP